MEQLECVLWSCIIVFVFFKQKTAYEMRISDWSSDVCSSDLRAFKAKAARLQEAVETHDAKADRAFAAGAIFGAGHLRRGAVDIILQHIVEEAHDILDKLFVAIPLIPCFKVEG